MKKKKVSVIVPIYNSEKYLDRCVKSLLKQTYKNIEIILVDDGSTDNSANICEQYKKDNSNIVVIHQKNQGVSVARNSGLKMATGDYIAFVDADDYIDEDIYEQMMKQMEAQDFDLIICNIYFENSKSKSIIKKDYHDCVIKREDFPYEMYSQPTIQGYVWNKLYKKSIITKHKIEFKMGIAVLEDDLFNYIVFSNNKDLSIKYINDRLYHYVLSDTSISNSSFNIKKLSYLVVKNQEINILENEQIVCDYLKFDYIKAFKQMRFLSRINGVYSEKLFLDYTDYYKSIMSSIKFNGLKGLLKVKYIIVRFFPFVYYIKILFDYIRK